MESAYVDELKASINLLMANLESLPVTKGSNAESKYSLQKFKKYSKYVIIIIGFVLVGQKIIIINTTHFSTTSSR